MKVQWLPNRITKRANPSLSFHCAAVQTLEYIFKQGTNFSGLTRIRRLVYNEENYS
jgi:hypothetical protein